MAFGRAGPILGQYLCPVTASCGASWPFRRVWTALLPIVLSKLGRVRFPSSALDFVAVAPISIFAGPIPPSRGGANGVGSGRRWRCVWARLRRVSERRFVTSPEPGAHPDYVASLLVASGNDTVLTEWFEEGWPDAPLRVLRCVLDAARRSGWRRDGTAVPRRRARNKRHGDVGRDGGGWVTSSQTAAGLIADLASLL